MTSLFEFRRMYARQRRAGQGRVAAVRLAWSYVVKDMPV